MNLLVDPILEEEVEKKCFPWESSVLQPHIKNALGEFRRLIKSVLTFSPSLLQRTKMTFSKGKDTNQRIIERQKTKPIFQLQDAQARTDQRSNGTNQLYSGNNIGSRT